MMCVNKISLFLAFVHFGRVVQSATISSRNDIASLISDSATLIVVSPTSDSNTITFGSEIQVPSGKYLALQASGTLAFDGGNTNRLFNVEAGGSLTLIGITIQNVRAR